MDQNSGLAAVHAAAHAQPTPPAPQPGPSTATPAPAAVAPAVVSAPAPQPAAADTAAATAAGAAAAKDRIGKILKLDSAKGRDSLAHHLAFETDLTVEQADAVLKAAPATAAAASPFKDAMRDRNPNLGTGAAGTGKDGKEPAAAAPVKIDSRAIYQHFNNPLRK
jgi:hypothetical protein